MESVEFRPLQFRLGRFYYLLLPKLNRAQFDLLSRRVVAHGLLGSIHFDPSGFCRASFDLMDLILPAIPSVLEQAKEYSPPEEVFAKYATVGRDQDEVLVRFSTRIESTHLWELLRKSGECGLTPDEHAIAASLLGHASGSCRVLTDFPCEQSVRRIYSGRQYFESLLDVTEVASTLRTTRTKRSRNSYLPRNGILSFYHMSRPNMREVKELVDELGPWCGFVSKPKSSNG